VGVRELKLCTRLLKLPLQKVNLCRGFMKGCEYNEKRILLEDRGTTP